MPAAQAAQPADLSLGEMTRILDVASELRGQSAEITEQLNLDAVKADLRARLLAAADTSGEPVNEEEIAVAVEQFYDNLHEFREPPKGLSTTLAHIYIRRGWAYAALVLGGLAAAATAVLSIWVF